MSDCSPEHDLYECIQHEDIPLWFASIQIGDEHTARNIIERFLKHALVSLLRDGQPTHDWEWSSILMESTNWDQSNSHAQSLMLIDARNEQAAESFFTNLND